MIDPEKLQRKFLKEAASKRKLEDKAFQRRARPEPEAAPAKTHCARCLAMLKSDSSCPKCDHGETNYFTYCRKCLNVHAVGRTCEAWQPSPETYRA